MARRPSILNVIDILTIHQAKGLEWPVVFVPSLVQGRFPSSYAGREQEWLLTEKVFPNRSDSDMTEARPTNNVCSTLA